MVWVLWDILVPLLISGALGGLLVWLLTRRQQDRQGLVTAAGMTSSDNMAFDAGPDARRADSSADSELEAANIVLIGERDEATLALEDMHEEADLLKQRIVELEAADNEKSSQNATADPAEVIDDNQASEELKLVQADLDVLTDTLTKERNARRATELELLNAKNRHEKYLANVPTQISEEQHLREITDRDEQIDNLKQQLAERDDVASVIPVADGSPEDDQRTEEEQKPDRKRKSRKRSCRRSC